MRLFSRDVNLNSRRLRSGLNHYIELDMKIVLIFMNWRIALPSEAFKYNEV